MDGILRLRPFEDGDMALLRQWLYEPHVSRWFLNPESWLSEAGRRTGEFNWIRHFIVMLGDSPAGFCQYYEYRLSGETWHGSVDTEGAYSIDYLIGDPALLGRGLGRRMVAELTQEIGRLGSARRVIAAPDPGNPASRGTLLACGYRYDEKNDLYALELHVPAPAPPSTSTYINKRSIT